MKKNLPLHIYTLLFDQFTCRISTVSEVPLPSNVLRTWNGVCKGHSVRDELVCLRIATSTTKNINNGAGTRMRFACWMSTFYLLTFIYYKSELYCGPKGISILMASRFISQWQGVGNYQTSHRVGQKNKMCYAFIVEKILITLYWASRIRFISSSTWTSCSYEIMWK